MTLARLMLAQAQPRPQFADQMQDLSEQQSWHRDFGRLECDVVGMGYDLRADLDEFFLEARQRPVLDPFPAGPASA